MATATDVGGPRDNSGAPPADGGDSESTRCSRSPTVDFGPLPSAADARASPSSESEGLREEAGASFLRKNGKPGDPAYEELFVQRVQDGDTAWLSASLEGLSPQDASAMANLVSNGLSVLMLAIRYQFPNVVQLLLNNGADPTYDCKIRVHRSKRGKGGV